MRNFLDELVHPCLNMESSKPKKSPKDEPEDVITFVKTSNVSVDAKELLDEAEGDTFIGSVIKKRKPNSFTGFYCNDILVGFAIPRQEGKGYRTGPIYVKPAYRKKGIAKAFVSFLFKGKTGNAYIEQNNTASQKLFLSCGFVKQDKFITDGDDILYLYKKLK